MTVQVSYPGVYIEEFAPGAPIQGVGTSTAAFLGTALQGPIGTPTRLQSWDAFQRVFGGFIEDGSSYLAAGVFGFFLNGGTDCFVVRAGTGARASTTLGGVLDVRAKAEGTGGNAVTVTVAHGSRLADQLAAAGAAGTTLAGASPAAAGSRKLKVTVPAGLSLPGALPRGTIVELTEGGTTEEATVAAASGDTITFEAPLAKAYTAAVAVASLEFDLTVVSGGTTETFARLSMNPTNPKHWSTVDSAFVALGAVDGAPPSPRPAAGGPTALAGGADDNPAAALNDPTPYLTALEAVDEVAVVCAPGITDTVVQQALRDHCEKLQDRFAVLDATQASGGDDTFGQVSTQFADVRSERGFAALYYPWITVRSPVSGRTVEWPPSGHVVGLYARTDASEGVHKAPANENLRGALGLQVRLSDQQHGVLNLVGVNVLRVLPGQGQPVVMGARTTALDRNWQYVNIRRLFIFLEESIQEGIRWAVFEPNNLQLWQKLKRSITAFLTQAWRSGALFGETADDAFYVRIDEALNPPNERALGRLYIEIGLQPVYPAEFIVVRIGIWDGGGEVSE